MAGEVPPSRRRRSKRCWLAVLLAVTLAAVPLSGASSSDPADPDRPGVVTFDSETPAVGVPLTASVSDPDGEVSWEIWVWERSTADGGWESIPSWALETYVPTQDDLGRHLRVAVSYLEGGAIRVAPWTATATPVAEEPPVIIIEEEDDDDGDDGEPPLQREEEPETSRQSTGPTISSFSMQTTPASGQNSTYKIGDKIEVRVTWSANVTLGGTDSPTLALTVGSNTRTATYEANSHSGAYLDFEYTVVEGDLDTDGISIASGTVVTLPSGVTLKGTGTSTPDAALTHSTGLAAQSGHKVDGVRPKVTKFSITSTPAQDNTYWRGEQTHITVHFSENITASSGLGQHVTDEDLNVKVSRGGPTRTLGPPRILVDPADPENESKHVNQDFTDVSSLKILDNAWSNIGGRRVEHNEVTFEGIRILTDQAMTLRSGRTIKDAAGNDLVLTLDHLVDKNDKAGTVQRVGPFAEHKVNGGLSTDATLPGINSIAVTSTPASGSAYAPGETITVRATLSERSLRINVGLLLAVGDKTVLVRGGATSYQAADVPGSAVDFSYVVRVGDADADGISVPANAIRRIDGSFLLNGEEHFDNNHNVIREQVPLRQNHAAVAAQSGHKVDTAPKEHTLAAASALVPDGLTSSRFRLLYFTKIGNVVNGGIVRVRALSGEAGDYNDLVIADAAEDNELRPFKDGFRAIVSTKDVHARDNTATAPADGSAYADGEGVPIYWVLGDKVADDYADFYDDSWDSRATVHRDGARVTVGGIGEGQRGAWTGSNADGTRHTDYLGATSARWGADVSGFSPLSYQSTTHRSQGRQLWALSPVLAVSDTTRPAKPSGLSVAGATHACAGLTWTDLADDTVTGWQYRLGTGAWTDIAGSDEDTTAHTVCGLSAGASSVLRVRAFDTGGAGTASDPVTAATTNTVSKVPGDWAYIPTDLLEGDRFRTLFITSTDTSVRSGSIDHYNNHVRARADSNAVLKPFKDGFRAVASTATVDARDNTGTAPANGSKYVPGEGEPVYWANGKRVADDYADFYDGSWTNVGSGDRRNESGGTEDAYRPATGSINEGTKHGDAYLGHSTYVRVGDVRTGNNPLSGTSPQLPDNNGAASERLLGMSPALEVGPLEVAPDWDYVPEGIGHGQSFRLLFVTSTNTNVKPGSIEHYNNHVRARADTNTVLKPFKHRFRAIASTATVDARDNTGTAPANGESYVDGEGEPVYWLGGPRVADDYADFYDNRWPVTAQVESRTESGSQILPGNYYTGSEGDGTKHQYYLGQGEKVARGNNLGASRPLDNGSVRLPSGTAEGRILGMSPRITVNDAVRPVKPAGFKAVGNDRQALLWWDDPDDKSITGWQYRIGAGSWVDIPGSDRSTTSHVVRNLTNGTAYSFTVRAVDAVGPGPASDAATATPGAVNVPPSWGAIPTGVNAGDTFHLMFVTSTTTKAESGDISVYNTHVQNAANNNTALAPFKGQFRALICTATVDGRDNTGTGPIGSAYADGEGVPVYWLGSDKVADDYKAFYDGTWDSGGDKRKTEAGSSSSITNIYEVFTGCGGDGTAYYDDGTPGHVGADEVAKSAQQQLRAPGLMLKTWERGIYAMSPPITVRDAVRPVKPTGFKAVGGHKMVHLAWGDPSDPTITKWQYRIGSGAWTDIAGSGAATVSHTVSGLVNGRAYTMSVRAVDTGGAGPPSDTVSVTPAAPAAQTVEPGWAWIPTGVNAGESFRVMFLTSTSRNAQSTDISAYNTHVQNAAGNNTALAPFKEQFRAVLCTGAVDARDNTASAPANGSSYASGEGEPIWWLGGVKVADNYADFYDGDWGSPAGRLETVSSGNTVQPANERVWSGCQGDGTKEANIHVGKMEVRQGTQQYLSLNALPQASSGTTRLYALSPTITVRDLNRPVKPAGLTAVAGFASVTLSWDDPSDGSIRYWEYRQGSGAWVRIPRSNRSTTSHVVTGLAKGSYTFRVRAVDTVGAGAVSDPATAATGRAPLAQTVQPDWAHIPDDIGHGDSFRLLFITSETTSVHFGSIKHYNDHVRARAATNTALAPFKGRFRAVASTGTVDARDNTGTAPANGSRYADGEGEPVYWVDGKRVANDYADFYDDIWANVGFSAGDQRNESGAAISTILVATGSKADGTKHTYYLGLGRGERLQHGDPRTGNSPLSAVNHRTTRPPHGPSTGRIYGLSPTINVLDTILPARPAGFRASGGDKLVILRWDDPDDATITGWQYRQDGGAWTPIAGSDASTTKHRLRGLTNDQEYRFELRAVDAGGEGPAASASATPRGQQPVVPQTVEPGSNLIPYGFHSLGYSFRLMFVTSTFTDATSDAIEDYNSFVQEAARTNPDLAPFADQFRAMISTPSIDAVDNIDARTIGVPVWWLGGERVAPSYGYLCGPPRTRVIRTAYPHTGEAQQAGVPPHYRYEVEQIANNWDSRAATDETGGLLQGFDWVWTGSQRDCTRHPDWAAGSTRTASANPKDGNDDSAPLFSGHSTVSTYDRHRIYAIGPVITVARAVDAKPAPVGGDRALVVTWPDAFDPDDCGCWYSVSWRTDSRDPWSDRPSALLPDDANSYRIEGLVPGTTYEVRVDWVNSFWHYAEIGRARATTYGSPVPLARPTGVTATPIGGGELTVTWDPVLGADAYKVQWTPPGHPYNATRQGVVLAGGIVPRYRIDGLVPGQPWSVRVIAMKTGRPDSPPSAPATATP